MKKIIIVLTIIICLSANVVSAGEKQEPIESIQIKGCNEYIEDDPEQIQIYIDYEPTTIYLIDDKSVTQIFTNSFSNLNNYGFTVECDDWLYYTNFNKNESLYRKKGKYNELILDRKQVYGINYNYYKKKLYFGCFNEEKECMQLCCINKDGYEFEELIDNIGNDIYSIDKYIYYTIQPYYKLYRLDLSTGEIEQLTRKRTEYINIYNKKLYYVNRNNIKELDLDTGEEKLLKSEKGIKHLQYFDNCLYYSCDEGIKKINLDTYEIETLLENKAELQVKGLAVSYNCILFLGYNFDEENEKENQFVYKIDHDGSNLTQIYDKENISKINVYIDKIFITNDKFAESEEDKFIKIIDYEGNEIYFQLEENGACDIGMCKMEWSTPYSPICYGIPCFLRDILGNEKVDEWLFQFESLDNPDGRDKFELNVINAVKEMNVPKDGFIKESGEIFTEEQIEAMFLGDQKLINRAFINEGAILIDDEIYSADWIVNHSVDDYKKVGITEEVLNKYLEKIINTPLKENYEILKERYKKLL